jgi:hypothetical protein
MATGRASRTTTSAGTQLGDEVTAQEPLFVHSCNRLGRSANPPRFSLTDWLLPGLRR